jgi:hypothetical protein
MTFNERERDMEARLRRATTGHTATVPEPPDRWSDIEAAAASSRRRDHRRRAALAALSLAAAIAIIVASVVVLRGPPAPRLLTTPATGPSGPSGPTGPSGPASTSPALSTSTSTPPTSTPPALPVGLLPVWPFASADGVRAWQDSYHAGGQQPWHLDAGQTASAFTAGYLGFKDISLVLTQNTAGRDAHVAVGSATSAGPSVTAAVIHLVRFGSGADAPWEVVGTDDTGGLTLTAPTYGSTVTSPIAVGGTITGVDENIHVQVRQLSTTTAVGEACCHPAGGTNTPWTMPVSFRGTTDRVLTIVAWTGGHLLQIERFAITAVRT